MKSFCVRCVYGGRAAAAAEIEALREMKWNEMTY